MPTIELVYDHDCPNVAQTRAKLLRAFSKTGVAAKWTEWERSSPETPAHVRQFGSPAILVNGHDVAGMSPNAASACRIYHASDGGSAGVPSVELISRVLRQSYSGEKTTGPANGLKKQLALLPAILFALLPKVACPACWPAYVGLLSAVGLGFLARTEYQLPLTAVFLAFILASLVYRANTRRGYQPFLFGLAGTVITLIGKFMLESDFIFYFGLAGVIASSIWNTWPRKQSKTAPCCIGVQGGTQVTTRAPRS